MPGTAVPGFRISPLSRWRAKGWLIHPGLICWRRCYTALTRGQFTHEFNGQNRLYGAEGVGVAAFSGALSGTGAAVPSLTRNGKKGVTSNGIFSAAEFSATGFVLINSSRFVQGSTLTRPPMGNAAI